MANSKYREEESHFKIGEEHCEGFKQKTCVLVIGHSYVKRYGKDIWRTAKLKGSSIMQAAGFKEEDAIDLWYYGESGGKIKELLIDHEDAIIRHQPKVLIIDVGINDVGDHRKPPENMASELVRHAEIILEGFTGIEIIVLCYVLHRDRITRSIKTVETYNKDVDIFNKQLLCCSRKNLKILRWKHIGLKTLSSEVSTDSVHPDTELGMTRYKKSIYACSKMARNEMLVRRVLSKTQIKKVQKERRAKKMAKGFEKLKAKYPDMQRRDKRIVVIKANGDDTKGQVEN